MDPSEILWLPIAYLAVLIGHRQRNPHMDAFQVMAPIHVRRVTAQDAPTCIEVRWPPGHAPAEMSWRYFAGAFWRPLLDPGKRIIPTRTGFEDLARNARGDLWWSDYPFRIRLPDEETSVGPFRLEREIPVRSRVLHDGREAACDAAQRLADADLIIVDGMLHRRSPPPVFGVGDPACEADQVPVCLTAPEFCPGTYLAYFSLDRQDCALEFARRLVAERPSGRFRAQRRISRQALNNTRWTVHQDVPFPDERIPSFQRTFNHLRRRLAGVLHRDLPTPFYEAYATLSKAGRELQDDPLRRRVDSIVAEAFEAIDMIIATKPAGGNPRSWAKSIEMIASAQKWRFEIEGDIVELADQADEIDEADRDALAGLRSGAIPLEQ
jgi:hypothetical protein